MFQRTLLRWIAARGKIAAAYSRAVYLPSKDKVTYFHDYQLDNGNRYSLKWRPEPECEFQEGQCVQFQYSERTFNDKVYFDIIERSISAVPTEEAAAAATHAATATAQSAIAGKTNQQQQPRLPGDDEHQQQQQQQHQQPSSLTAAQQRRLHTLQIVKDLLVAQATFSSSSNSNNKPLTLEAMVSELIQGAIALERQFVVGEEGEVGEVTHQQGVKSPIYHRSVEMPEAMGGTATTTTPGLLLTPPLTSTPVSGSHLRKSNNKSVDVGNVVRKIRFTSLSLPGRVHVVMPPPSLCVRVK